MIARGVDADTNFWRLTWRGTELPNNSVSEKPVAALTIATQVSGATWPQWLDASKLIVA
jgi:hypothetical protein